MKFTPKDIIEIYSYSEDEQETFEYIRKYMKRITPKLEEIQKDDRKLKKFALIGLFLTYRGCNHRGENFTTEFTIVDSDNVDEKRMIAIKQYFGISINNTEEYLKLIKLSFFGFFFYMSGVLDISTKFYKFIMK